MHRVAVFLTLAIVLFAYLMLRANIHLHYTLGLFWVYLRYTLPTLPMLLAASMLVVRDLKPSWRQWLATAVLALVEAKILCVS